MTARRNIPPLNTSKAAVELRRAAQAFGKLSWHHQDVIDDQSGFHSDEDREGQRVNRRLLRAAMRYALAVQADEREEVVHHG